MRKLFPTLLSLFLAASLPARAERPALENPIPDVQSSADRETIQIDLSEVFHLPEVEEPIVQLDTTSGLINIELFETQVPNTVENFLRYRSRYSRTIIHRGETNKLIKGGGYERPPEPMQSIARDAPLADEFGVPPSSNTIGTIALDKAGGAANTGTSEWFINLSNNAAEFDGIYTVFGRVLGDGIEVVDEIGDLPILARDSPFDRLPVVNYTAPNELANQNVVVVRSVTEIPIYPEPDSTAAVLSFSATSSSNSLVTTSISGSILSLDFPSGSEGTVTISVEAEDSHGDTAEDDFEVTVVRGVTSNNTFASPESLSGASDSAEGFNTGGSKEPGEPAHAGNTGGASLWYTWTAPSTGAATVTTDGSDFDTLLAVYTGTAINSLRSVAANDDADGKQTSRVVFAALSGVTYRIAVDGKNGATGNVDLAISLESGTSVPVPGVYIGLIASDDPGFNSTGDARLTIGGNRSFSAHLRFAGFSYRFKGRFDNTGRFFKKIRDGSNPVFVLLELATGNRITGSISSNTLAAALELELSTQSFPLPDVAAPLDRLTFAIAGGTNATATPTPTPTPGLGGTPVPGLGRTDDDTPPVPEGDGFGTGAVRGSGLVLLTGRLGDNAPFSFSNHATIGSRFPFHVLTHRRRAVISGWVTLPTATAAGTGGVEWFKLPNDNTDNYPEGFELSTTITLSPYSPPLPGERFVTTPDQLENLTVTIVGSNLRRPIEPFRLTLRLDNRLVNADGFSLRLNKRNGLVRGIFRERRAFRDRAYFGALIQSSDEVRSLFEANSQTGSVRIAGSDAGPAPSPSPTPTPTPTASPTASPTATASPFPSPTVSISL